MKPEQHRARAERIERSIALLSDDDWEMRIEAAMLAGTHWANLALHRRGVSTDSEDVIHTTMCAVNVLRKYELAEGELLGWLAGIEELRPLYVRGDVEGGVQAAAHALQWLASIGDRARALEAQAQARAKAGEQRP